MLAALALSSVLANAGQITHTVSYDPSKLSITYDTICGAEYANINFEGLASSGLDGFPRLPYDVITLSVPYNSTNFNVQVDSVLYTDFFINAPIIPSQKDRIVSDTTSFIFTNTNDSVYNLKSFFPATQSSILSYGYLFGNNKVINIGLLPISYAPFSGTIRVMTSAKIILTYDKDSRITPLYYRLNEEKKEEEINLLTNIVSNGSSVRINAYNCKQNQNISRNTNSQILPTYNYCIITSRKLESSFKKMIAMKRQKGLSAGAICIEDLMASSLYNGGDVNYNSLGDTISILTDSAGVVRQYLKYAYNCPVNPTQYVLLGGNAPNAPIRYVKSNSDSSPNKNHIATDMYFSDLDQVWQYYPSSYNNEYVFKNADNNNKSFEPELFVGRILCNNKEEVDNYSNKLHQYVFNPGNGSSDYINNALVVSINEFKDYTNGLIDSLDNIYHNHITCYRGDGTQEPPTGEDIINDINDICYGYISLYGHGEPQAIQVFNNSNTTHVVTALDSNRSITSSNVAEEMGNGLDCLKNKYKPSIIYSISCVTMPYDKAPSFYFMTSFENKCNLGESFTLGKNYGGVAFLGNTRRGYLGASSELERYFVGELNKGHYSVGVAEALSKTFLNLNSSTYLHVSTEHNLLGDPEFEIWTNEPQQYNGITISQYNNYIIVNGISASDTIAYCDNDGNVGRTFGANGFDYIVGISPTTSIMVYNHDHIPYIAPLKLQNCNINNSQYVYASSFSAGKSILPNIANGDVTIKNGAVYEIEATDDVHLGEGFIVENGATFAIKTPGKVTIDGCVFQSGAKVKIEAGKVEVIGKFTAELGSKVEMTYIIIAGVNDDDWCQRY